MTIETPKPKIGALPEQMTKSPALPGVLTWLVWSLFITSLALLVVRVRVDSVWELPGIVAVDGLTVLMWTVVTFVSGIVHSYSRRYMAGSVHQEKFFTTTFGFTLVVMALVAADHLVLFGLCWLAMGLLMAALIGTVSGWKQAQAAASLARRYFMASSTFIGVALGILWWTTGSQTVSGITASPDTLGGPMVVIAAGSLVLAAMIQSGLIPFQSWLLTSMTAPTPASALMHAGFVNAGGILLTRFWPVVTADATLMLAIVAIGAASAAGGKLLKSVQVDIKGQLGCSTIGQMGFMILQAGLGFFGAAITHLILHGWYKGYQFLSSGEAIEHQKPKSATKHTIGRPKSTVSFLVAIVTGLAGGVIFSILTGKGASIDSGLLLTFFVVVATLHASRSAIQHTSLPGIVQYGAVPLVFFPAIIIYAMVYEAVSELLAVPTATTELTVLHGIIAVSFLGIYIAIETGVHEQSKRLYVALLNATQPPSKTLLTAREEYNEY